MLYLHTYFHLLALGLFAIVNLVHASTFTSLTYASASCPSHSGEVSQGSYEGQALRPTLSRGHAPVARSFDDRRSMLRRRGAEDGHGQDQGKDNGGDSGRGTQGSNGWSPVGPPQVQVVSKCSVPNTVALTFDDGPSQYLKEIATTLKNANATGTFFLNGKDFGCIYDQEAVDSIKYAYDQGHLIASHTWLHQNLVLLGWDQINEEMQKVDEALTKILGVLPAYMRPPYGSLNDLVTRAANSRGQTVVLWDFDSQDSAGASADTSKGLYDQVIGRHPDNILTLNHDTKDTTAHDVLPYAIQKLQAAGYRLVSVAECLGMQPYQKVGAPSARDDSWKC
ncbi:hypothetical protein BKA70DRAFT_1573776 [Coprinopsis sp. MPI-PUGE-AT-0042]|nr:hypothetical protein BKA70DRAFT_1573776 [Coprinopsis sp. MPI-PUGE-AT-0042]